MLSNKDNSTKIQKSEIEYKKLEVKYEKQVKRNKILSKDNKYLRRRDKQIKESRENWKEKLKSKQVEIKLVKAQLARGRKVKRHHYELWLIELCVQLRIQGNCSYQSICKILGIIDICFKLNTKKIPCANSVQNWVSKVGLFCIENTDKYRESNKVSLIVDESIRLGKEKLLLILSVPFEKRTKTALGFEDVVVEYMKGSESWTGEKISKVIKGIIKRENLDVKNILSDEDSKLKKACRLLEIEYIPDITHAMATCLKKTYKEHDRYNSFTKLIASYQSKGVNQDLSYLCPPKQRSKARFLNQYKVVKWSDKMIENFDELNQKEQTFFSELKDYKDVIQELSICMSIEKAISTPLKKEGLSKNKIKQTNAFIEKQAKNKGRVKAFINKVKGYMSIYEEHIKGKGESIVHVSSEIIESMFGKYKKKGNNYALTGLTNLNLELPMYCLSEKKLTQQIQVALESNSMTDIFNWRDRHSSVNQLVKRLKFFKKRTKI